jgi:hypothetical protein
MEEKGALRKSADLAERPATAQNSTCGGRTQGGDHGEILDRLSEIPEREQLFRGDLGG